MQPGVMRELSAKTYPWVDTRDGDCRQLKNWQLHTSLVPIIVSEAELSSRSGGCGATLPPGKGKRGAFTLVSPNERPIRWTVANGRYVCAGPENDWWWRPLAVRGKRTEDFGEIGYASERGRQLSTLHAR